LDDKVRRKVFNALRADIQFNVRIENKPVQLI